MNSKLNILLLIFLTIFTTISCGKNGDNEGESTPSVFYLGDGSEEFLLTKDMTLTAANIYILKGFVYVPDGMTLTIEPGVVIKGDKQSKATLIVERGGKIIAEGTKDKPIVFTSSQPAGNRAAGDWGGIIILGKAQNNNGESFIEGGVRSWYGGDDDDDCSGVLKYVRIEFAGVEYDLDNEINALTLGSVGSKTVIDHVQVSYSGDDSFEWFGGSVNATNLISLGAWDDDFDTDNGFSGSVQYGLVVRDSLIADKSASNGFESDNNSKYPESDPVTSAVFSNISMFGPVDNVKGYKDKGDIYGSPNGFFQSGVQIRSGSHLSLYNSLITGFVIGLIVEDGAVGSSFSDAVAGIGSNIQGVAIAGCVKDYQDYGSNNVDIYHNENGDYIGKELITSFFKDEKYKNLVFDTPADLKLTGDLFALTAPVAIPNADSPLIDAGVVVEGATSIKPTSYVGAFSPDQTLTNNWTSGWSNFDPQNTFY